jgi:ATP-dependent Lhr-like helicase
MTFHPVLNDFHPAVQRWFESAYPAPSPPQILGWPSISSAKNTLILAPTGSGKTLAAFLWAINHLVEQRLAGDTVPGIRILYVSPLKALNNDIERNLETPLSGIRDEAHRAGLKLPPIHTAVRTGDTPQQKRAAMLRHPPDILITTPESLYLMLTSRQARRLFTTVQYLIIDEIHSICGNKRGVHLSLTVERLQAIATQEIIRIGLSATQKPLDQIAAFLGGLEWNSGRLLPRPVNIIDAGQKKTMDLRVECAAPDFSLLTTESVWPLVFTEILAIVRSHRTTLIFVNNRRLAERIAAKLNEMDAGDTNQGYAAGRMFNMYAVPHSTEMSAAPAGERPPLVQAYHGSMSRQARERMERELKDGRIRGLVATSALELGIDIGSIDCVLQIQSPKGVARGLQRVGRSGHLVTAESKGRIFPTHREDLVEAAVIGRAMLEHEVEPTTIPTDCLDVLAQQIVAMVSVEDWHTDALYDLVRQSACYHAISRKVFAGVLQMLSGRYTQEAFRELRPRISWDRVNDVLRALPGSSRLAVTSGGTIADRGYFGVYLSDKKTKVGEVDEEFIFETRVGDTFILGTSVWRVIDMDPNRVLVQPAPGQPARMPFWRGEGIGRSYELGTRVGAFRREMSTRIQSADCLSWLQGEYPLDSRAAWNIQEYFRRQQSVAGFVPHDRLLLVEAFRDEIGDPRIVVHSPFGRRVNGLLGLILARRLEEQTGIEPQLLYNDNGVLLRGADGQDLPLTLFEGFSAEKAINNVLEEVLYSPLFGGQFRQNAGRALLMPKNAPGKRTPLWLQRLRAADLLQIARRFSDFPIVIETIREVLHDILDVEHFKELAAGIETGAIQIQTVTTEIPSPFTASLLFDFIAVYMYEWDQPRADRLSQYLAVNRELLSELVDLETVPSLLRPEAITVVEELLQHRSGESRARSPEELMEILLRIGDLSAEEILARCAENGNQMIRALASDGRAVQVAMQDGPRWVAGEDKALYTDLSREEHARAVISRFLLSHGPVSCPELARRFGFTEEHVRQLADSLGPAAGIARGRFRPPGMPDADREQWCYRPNLERIHRQTLSILRKEITPCSASEFSRFLLHWQHVHPSTRFSRPEDVEECLEQLQGLPLPASIWERDILRSRIGDRFLPEAQELSRRGELVWAGAGPGKLLCFFRGEGGAFLESPQVQAEQLSEPGRRILTLLQKHGASFLSDLRAGDRLSLPGLNAGIAELFWGGWITNDVFEELTALQRSAKLPPDAPLERAESLVSRQSPNHARLLSRARKALRRVPGWSGRWSVLRTPGNLGEELTGEERAGEHAELLLRRYGIVAREFSQRESLAPWPVIAAEFQRMEMRGEIRRGYFVEGFSGMQYAHPDAVEELRRLKREKGQKREVCILNACDPANLCGPGELATVLGGAGGVRFSRMPGNFVAFEEGTPLLWIENEGSRIWTLGRPETERVHEALRQLVALMQLPSSRNPLRSITVEYWDGDRPAGSSWASVLRQLGFRGAPNQTMRLDQYS